MAQVTKGGSKGRKIGRNLVKCQRYRDLGIREENKRRKLLKHLKKHPNDPSALGAFRMLGGKL